MTFFRNSLIYVINTAVSIFNLLLIARVLISWISPDVRNPNWRKFLRIVYFLTEPVLSPIRKILPPNSIGLDFSPVIAIVAITIIRALLIDLLYLIL
ncbi:MAG: YggT family protein [Halanaerobiales bacterium]